MAEVDQSYQLLSAQYVKTQAERLARELAGCRRAKDVESVHQARVASRRLRAAMRMFDDCFPGKKARRWRKEVRRLTGGLGPARDVDVQAQFVKRSLSELTDGALRAGVRRLLLRLQQARHRLQPRVVRAVQRARGSGAVEEMIEVAKATETRLAEEGVSVHSPFVFLRAERLILRRLEGVLTLQDCLADPADAARHHEMRIATKRLRYTMEICRPVYDERLREFLAAAKQIQTYLGDIHDCDVWTEALPAFRKAERLRTAEYYGSARPFKRLAAGIEHLIEDRRRRREEAFAELTDYWRECTEAGTWDRLAGMIVSAVQQSAAPAPDQPTPPPAEEESEQGEPPAAPPAS